MDAASDPFHHAYFLVAGDMRKGQGISLRTRRIAGDTLPTHKGPFSSIADPGVEHTHHHIFRSRFWDQHLLILDHTLTDCHRRDSLHTRDSFLPGHPTPLCP